MDLYRTRSEVVEAYKLGVYPLSSSGNDAYDLAAWVWRCGGKAVALSEDNLTLDAPTCTPPMDVPAGWWVVRLASGNFTAMSDAEFWEKYDPRSE